jgi:hypothetical protein
MQHEIDHLDGILMLDRPDRDSRKASMRQWREWVLARAPGNQKSPSFQRR